MATAAGTFTLAVIRDVTQARKLADLADLARAAAAARQAHDGQELLDSVIASLYHVGLSRQAAADLPGGAASQGIAEALQHLDDTIRQIRDTAFTTCGRKLIPHPETMPGDATPERARDARQAVRGARSMPGRSAHRPVQDGHSTDIAISLICEAPGPARRASLAQLSLYVTGGAGQPSAVPRPLGPNRRSP